MKARLICAWNGRSVLDLDLPDGRTARVEIANDFLSQEGKWGLCVVKQARIDYAEILPLSVPKVEVEVSREFADRLSEYLAKNGGRIPILSA